MDRHGPAPAPALRFPVGEETLGTRAQRVGEPVDEMGPVNAKKKLSDLSPTPEFVDQETKSSNRSKPASKSSICSPPMLAAQDRPVRRRRRGKTVI